MDGVLNVSLTNKCNIKCRHCGSQNQLQEPPSLYMSFDTWKEVCRIVPKGWHLELNSLGEQTIHPQFLEFIEYLVSARRGEISLKLQTNGMWSWTREKAEGFVNQIVELAGPGRHSQIHFSIDGGTKETVEWVRKGGNFERIMSNLRLALEVSRGRVEIGIAYAAVKRNLGEIVTLLEQAPKGLKWFYLNILNVCTEEMIPESLFDLQEEYLAAAREAKAWCESHGINFNALSAPSSDDCDVQGCRVPFYMYVDTQGVLHPCCMRWDHNIATIHGRTWADLQRESRTQGRVYLLQPQCDTCFVPETFWGWQRHFSTEDFYRRYCELMGR